GLAEPGLAVDEQRVVRLGRRLGDRYRGGVGEPVARADDEGVERVLRVQPGVAGGAFGVAVVAPLGRAATAGVLAGSRPAGRPVAVVVDRTERVAERRVVGVVSVLAVVVIV